MASHVGGWHVEFKITCPTKEDNPPTLSGESFTKSTQGIQQLLFIFFLALGSRFRPNKSQVNEGQRPVWEDEGFFLQTKRSPDLISERR